MRGLVAENELHLNPERKGGYLNGICGDLVAGTTKLVAVKYRYDEDAR